MKNRAWMLAAAVGALTAGPALGQEKLFDEVVSFGDSFSDIGNLSNAITPGVFNSHTTNPGNTAVENLAEHYGVDQKPSVIDGGRNYAVSGARVVGEVNPGAGVTPATAAQIPNFLGDVGGAISPRTLFTFIAGGADINAIGNRVRAGTITPAQGISEAQGAAAAAVQQITTLQQAGARTIVVGRVSLNSSAVEDPLRAAFNTALNEGMAGRTGIVPINTPDIFGGIVSDPARFGLTNLTDPACTVPNALNCTAATLVAPNAGQTHFFSDATHPSTVAHRIVADVMIAQLAAPQQMSLLAETPLALTALHREAARTALVDAGDRSRVFASFAILGGGFDRTYDTTGADNLGLSLTAGLQFDLAEDLKASLALNLSRSILEFEGGGQFDTNTVLASASARRTVGERGYLAADAYLGFLAYGAIERQFAVGISSHTEEGATTGAAYGASAGGGWLLGEGVRHGPFGEVNLQTIKVNAYGEGVHPGSAMTFANQTRNSLVAEIGWRMEGAGDRRPFAAIAYAKDFEAGERRVTAGLRTLNGTFSLPAIPVSEDWISLRAGAQFRFTQGLSGVIAYQGRLGDRSDAHGLTLTLRRPL